MMIQPSSAIFQGDSACSSNFSNSGCISVELMVLGTTGMGRANGGSTGVNERIPENI
jgi:hypothetical protein